MFFDLFEFDFSIYSKSSMYWNSKIWMFYFLLNNWVSNQQVQTDLRKISAQVEFL